MTYWQVPKRVMNGFIHSWIVSLAVRGRNSLNNVKSIGYKWSKRLSVKCKGCSHREPESDYFTQSLRDELHRVVDSIQPRDALSDIRKRIQEAPDEDIPSDGNSDGKSPG